MVTFWMFSAVLSLPINETVPFLSLAIKGRKTGGNRKGKKSKAKPEESELRKGKGATRMEEVSRRTSKIVRHYSKGLRKDEGAVTKFPLETPPKQMTTKPPTVWQKEETNRSTGNILEGGKEPRGGR